MADNRHEGVPALRPLPGLMDGLHGPPLTCMCTVICLAKGGCSSCRQLGKAHLLGLRQPELPASQEERGEVREGWGRRDTKGGPQTPRQQHHRPRIHPEGGTEFWARCLASVDGGTMDVLCDCGLVT